MSIAEVMDRKDRPAYVRFEVVPIENKAASVKEGRYVAKDVDFALVTPPYSKDVFKIKVEQWFKNLEQDVMNQRIPQEWVDKYKDAYKRWKAGHEIPLDGTPIKGWGILSPSQQEMMISIGIRTVEDLAAVNDEGKRRIGIGAEDFKVKASAWLSQLKDKGPLTQEMAELKARNSVLEGELSTLRSQVEALMSKIKTDVVADVVVSRETPEEIKASDILDDDPKVAYEKKFGKPPHHRMKLETIEEALRA